MSLYLAQDRHGPPGLIIDAPSATTTPLAARFEPGGAALTGFDIIAEAQGRFGMAFLLTHLAGLEMRLEIRLRPGDHTRFRAEVHGQASRMQKAYLEFDAQGEVLVQGEEILAAAITAGDDGELTLTLVFVPHASMLQWFFLTAEAGASGHFGLICLTQRQAAARSPERRADAPFLREVDGVLASISTARVLGQYLELEFEVHKPGHVLTGLAIASPAPLEALQWFTHQPLQPAAGSGEALPGTPLTARLPPFPYPSPALLERLGAEHGMFGHRISALYRDAQDLRMLPGPQGDAQLRELCLHASFSDGSRVALMVGDFQALDLYRGPEFERIVAHAAALGPERERVLVEVGARGPASRDTRKLYAPHYRYIGVDRWSDENVDLVADAHDLSTTLGFDSADVIVSHNVMEHLLSPTQFVIEANKVLRVGGLFVAMVPCIWPLHAEPWDYWRMSIHAWRGLLNPLTGFEIESAREIGWASVVPQLALGAARGNMQHAPAPMFTTVLARKTHRVEGVSAPWSAHIAVGRYDH